MERKKSPKADLEKHRSTFFQIGLVVSLTILLFAFECSRSTGELKTLINFSLNNFEDELIDRTYRKEKPKPKIEKPKQTTIDEIIKDDSKEETNIEINSEGGENVKIKPVDLPEEKPVKEDLIFDYVKEMPEFPGGEKALMKFLNDNVEFPQIAIDNFIEGTVYVYFVIDEYGKVTNVKILRGVDRSLDNAALAVVKKLPKWKPGSQLGKNVKVAFRVPIKFRVSK